MDAQAPTSPTGQKLLSLYRWEKPIEMTSALRPHEVIHQLSVHTVSSGSWRRLNRLTSNLPLVGTFTENSGTIRMRDFYPSMGSARRLIFHLEPLDGGGSRLCGTLQLPPSLQHYQLFCLIGMLGLQAWMIYLWLASGYPISIRGVLQILQEFGLIPFCWIYVRLVLWFGRKKEARMLDIVREAMGQSSVWRKNRSQ